MVAEETPLELAKQQAAQARARVDRQQALIRQGLTGVRARRVLTELTLVAELLEDRVAHLEAAAALNAGFRPGAEAQRGLAPAAVASR